MQSILHHEDNERNNKEEIMNLKSLIIGTAAALSVASMAIAERGSDGHVNIIYWQAPSILNPYLSGGTKDVESSSMIIEPLARYNQDGELMASYRNPNSSKWWR
jgi:peptide/nickel transport system substrate-binding protein